MRLCVVGVGALGRHHARILSQMHGVELVAVADPNATQGQQVADACGCEWTSDYASLLGRVDAASIVVPTRFHLRVASEFLNHGIPVLVEKPLAGTCEAGEQLVTLAAQQGLPLQVGHIERFNPAFRELENRCSDPKYIKAERMSPYPFRSTDIGVVHDLMIHDIELVLQLTGEMPQRVEAFGVSLVGGHEDCVQARLYFPGGCIADITAHRVCPTACRTMQVWTSEGCSLANLHSRQVTHFRPGDLMRQGQLPFDLSLVPGADIAALKSDVFGKFIDMSDISGGTADALTAELASFVECIRTGQTPEVDGQRGLAALRVAEQVLDCVSHHQWDGHSEGRQGPMALINSHLTGRQHRRAA